VLPTAIATISGVLGVAGGVGLFVTVAGWVVVEILRCFRERQRLQAARDLARDHPRSTVLIEGGGVLICPDLRHTQASEVLVDRVTELPPAHRRPSHWWRCVPWLHDRVRTDGKRGTSRGAQQRG